MFYFKYLDRNWNHANNIMSSNAKTTVCKFVFLHIFITKHTNRTKFIRIDLVRISFGYIAYLF